MNASGNDQLTLLAKIFGGDIGRAWLVRGQHVIDGRLLIVGEGRPGAVAMPSSNDLYYCVATTGRAGRTEPERVRVLVIDDVGTKIDREAFKMMFPLEPSFVVESSKGNFQVGFVIDGGMEVEAYKALRAAMKSNPIWGHSDGADAVHLFRLPGGVNSKPGRNGWAVRVVGGFSGKKYLPEFLVEKLAEGRGNLHVSVSGGSGAPAIAEGDTDLVEEKLLSALVGVISNDQPDRERWVSMAHAIWGASGGMEPDIFYEWSAKWSEGVDDPDANEKLWDSIGSSTIGRHWLIREAGVRGQDWLRLEAKAVFDDGEVPSDMGLGVSGSSSGVSGSVEATQLDVAHMIVNQHGAGLRYNIDSGKWHSFHGVWKESPFKLGYRLARTWAKAAVASGSLNKSDRKAISGSTFFDGVEKIMQSILAVTQDAFDTDDWKLGTPGGTVDLRTGKLGSVRADDMISLSTTVTPAEGEDCPKWIAFIKWACTDPVSKAVDAGKMKFLKQWAGYCLCGDVSEETVAFLFGSGGNGKGTYIETVQAVMGSYFHMATRDLFIESKHGPHTEEIAGLAGARMVAAEEVPTGARWNESLLKGVSGGGTMKSRHLYGKTFGFRIRFKVTITGNDKPSLQGTANEALKRRLRLVGFLNTANPRLKDYKRDMLAEAPGILRWMLNGLTEMLGSPGGKLFVPDSVLDDTEDYFNENDLFSMWMLASTETVKLGSVKASEAFSSWVDFRNRENNHSLYARESAFKAEMEKRGFVWQKTRTGNVFKGLTMKVF